MVYGENISILLWGCQCCKMCVFAEQISLHTDALQYGICVLFIQCVHVYISMCCMRTST